MISPLPGCCLLSIVLQEIPLHRGVESEPCRGTWWFGSPHTAEGRSPRANCIYLYAWPTCGSLEPSLGLYQQVKDESLLEVVNVIKSSNGCVFRVCVCVCGMWPTFSHDPWFVWFVVVFALLFSCVKSAHEQIILCAPSL